MSAYMAMARTCSLTKHHGADRSIILESKLILQQGVIRWQVNVNKVTFNDLQSVYGSQSPRPWDTSSTTSKHDQNTYGDMISWSNNAN